MSWNYRVLAHEHKGEVYFQIHEVHYSDVGKPTSYAQGGAITQGDNVDEVEWVLSEMEKCLKKPILSVKDFPKEFKR